LIIRASGGDVWESPIMLNSLSVKSTTLPSVNLTLRIFTTYLLEWLKKEKLYPIIIPHLEKII